MKQIPKTQRHNAIPGLTGSWVCAFPTCYIWLTAAWTLGTSSIPNRPGKVKQIHYILAGYGGLGRLVTRFLFVHNHLMHACLSVWSVMPHINAISCVATNWCPDSEKVVHIHKGILFTCVTSPHLHTHKAQSISRQRGLGEQRRKNSRARGWREELWHAVFRTNMAVAVTGSQQPVLT